MALGAIECDLIQRWSTVANAPSPPKKVHNIPTQLRLVATLILRIVQYGIIDSGSAGGWGRLYSTIGCVQIYVMSKRRGFKSIAAVDTLPTHYQIRLWQSTFNKHFSKN